jgi:hypothetical protein
VEGGVETNLNTAPPEVLQSLPGMGAGASAAIVARRTAGEPLRDTDQLLSLLSAEGRLSILQSYKEFAQRAVYRPLRFVAAVEGGVRATNLISRARVTMVPVAGRLAVMRRITE